MWHGAYCTSLFYLSLGILVWCESLTSIVLWSIYKTSLKNTENPLNTPPKPACMNKWLRVCVHTVHTQNVPAICLSVSTGGYISDVRITVFWVEKKLQQSTCCCRVSCCAFKLFEREQRTPSAPSPSCGCIIHPIKLFKKSAFRMLAVGTTVKSTWAFTETAECL